MDQATREQFGEARWHARDEDSLEPATQFARADDGAGLAWRAVGTGEPLLLVTGQAVDSTAREAIVPELSERYWVITFDHWGTGRSDAGAPQAHIYGHSMGGRAAQWLVIDHAARVASLVLGATTAGDARGVSRSGRATADLASGDPERLARLFSQSEEPRPDAAAFFNPSATRHAKRLQFAASRGHDVWDHLAGITVPTLVIHGTEDEMTPPGNAVKMAALIPQAELELRDGARHGYYFVAQGRPTRLSRFSSVTRSSVPTELDREQSGGP